MLAPSHLQLPPGPPGKNLWAVGCRHSATRRFRERREVLAESRRPKANSRVSVFFRHCSGQIHGCEQHKDVRLQQ